MKSSVFKRYDIRGRVPDEFMPGSVYDLARAFAVYIVGEYPVARRVVVGMDGRVHSEAIKDDVCRALVDSGFEVVFLGVCPTPLVYFAVHTQSYDAGIMITASHNGPEYNGLKMVVNRQPVWGAGIEKLQQLFSERARMCSGSRGVYQELSLHETYISWMLEHFAHLVGMTYPLVLDCGNGATGELVAELIERFEWKHVKALCTEIDGTFPVHHADPTRRENMQLICEQLAHTDALCGIGFDGDGDRMAAMTKSGILVGGDLLLLLFAEAIHSQHPGMTVVFDSKCSQLVQQMLTLWGVHPHMSPTGHSIIKSEMKKHHALLGGELSCHFFFNDRYFGYDDALYAAFRLIELLLLSRKSLDELLARWPHYFSTPEMRISCNEQDKESVVEQVKSFFEHRPDAQVITLDGVRVLVPYGTIMVRASHTESVVCVRWESETEQGFAQVSREMTHILTMLHKDQYATPHEAVQREQDSL